MRVVIIAALMLSGCADRAIVRDRIQTVSVPVIQKCASDRPADATSLRDRIDAAAWEALSLKQKAETIAAQGLRRMNHKASLEAATSTC
ncbi:hypothetical protein [Sphingopyxis sp.]|jgi:hypothetical protein|uniref:hypothetical protein n=1 Tax=Sphingopyxis sp. TaxID=1908224 RepID=UPI003F70B8EC